MLTATDWPELDPDGYLARDVPWGRRIMTQLPLGLEAWLRAAGGANGSSCVVRLALLAYLAEHYPALRPPATP